MDPVPVAQAVAGPVVRVPVDRADADPVVPVDADRAVLPAVSKPDPSLNAP